MRRSYDPADHRAKARQNLQLTRELKVERKAFFHPSIGGSKGYNLWYRQQQMERHQNDRDLLVGPALVSIVVCIIVYPQAQLNEIAMYLYNDGVGLYSNQLISQRLKERQITNKKLSIKAFKTYSPANMRRKFLFWNRQLPIGVIGIPWKHFIDVDEFAMEAKWLNKSNSCAICFRRVRTVGNYEKGQKLTVMIAVEPGDPELPVDVTGSIARPWQWVDVRRVAGTTSDNFASFIGSICTSIEDHQRVTETNIDNWRVFLWDNLSSHYSPIVYETVMGRVGLTPFDILPHPAYQQKYGPIKYAICQLLNHMKVNVAGELDLNQIEQQILDLAAAIGPFDAMFAHCGYSEDGVYPDNKADFSSSSSGNNDSTGISPNYKKPPTNKAPNKKAPPNPRPIKTTFLVSFKALSLSDLHQNKHSSALIKLQTKAINSGPTISQRWQNWNTKFMVPILASIHFRYKAYKKELTAFCATLQTSSRNNNSSSASTFQTQTIKYLDQIEKEFDGATNQYIEQMEAVAAKTRQAKQKKAKSVASSKGDRPRDFLEYGITKGDTFPCPKCGHMLMVMQLDTTENIAEYNQKAHPKPRRVKYKEQRVDPKELEEETAPKTMPGIVSMINDSIAEATHAKFLEDTTASKQDITCNACSSVFYQMASNPHLGSAKFQKTIKEGMSLIEKNTINGKNIHQLRAEQKGKTAVPSNDTRFHQNRLMTGIPGMDASHFLANHSKKKPSLPPTETLICTRSGSMLQPITIDGETNNSNQQPRTLMGTLSAMAPAKEIQQTPEYLLLQNQP
eukprot:jgi/Psemu1/17435/gm1.17435_g